MIYSFFNCKYLANTRYTLDVQNVLKRRKWGRKEGVAKIKEKRKEWILGFLNLVKRNSGEKTVLFANRNTKKKSTHYFFSERNKSVFIFKKLKMLDPTHVSTLNEYVIMKKAFFCKD